uniref:Nucleoside phosphorylase domain-containing protein n=1 Tax=Oryza punctata TaxID=4537 RepID=A0A0E0KZY6_ORYPU
MSFYIRKGRGIVHFGFAGNADPNLQIGDVTVPRYWAHTGLWNWQAILRSRLGVTPIDMETAAVALVALQQGAPFIAIRSLSDLAGGGSAESNEAGVFPTLASQNAVAVAVKFISLLTIDDMAAATPRVSPATTTLALLLVAAAVAAADAAVPASAALAVRQVNRQGPYLGVVVPNGFEMEPLLRSPAFSPAKRLPYLDVAGRRFRFGTIGEKKVIIVMTGLGMLNSGVTTQLLLTLFDVEGIVHFGIAGNADPNLHIGDVTVPRYWAHTGLWNWQRYGDGPENELALESNGDYTRKYGALNFSDYGVGGDKPAAGGNLLNSVWYQPEEVFPADGTPESRRHEFWVPVDDRYYQLSQKLEAMTLERCVNGTGMGTSPTCLTRPPAVARVERGCSASVFVDNAAYRQFLRSRLGVTPIDMETTAVALVAQQQGAPFIAIRSLSDLAGGGSAESNEAGVFAALAAQNAVAVAVNIIRAHAKKS